LQKKGKVLTKTLDAEKSRGERHPISGAGLCSPTAKIDGPKQQNNV